MDPGSVTLRLPIVTKYNPITSSTLGAISVTIGILCIGIGAIFLRFDDKTACGIWCGAVVIVLLIIIIYH